MRCSDRKKRSHRRTYRHFSAKGQLPSLNGHNFKALRLVGTEGATAAASLLDEPLASSCFAVSYKNDGVGGLGRFVPVRSGGFQYYSTVLLTLFSRIGPNKSFSSGYAVAEKMLRFFQSSISLVTLVCDCEGQIDRRMRMRQTYQGQIIHETNYLIARRNVLKTQKNLLHPRTKACTKNILFLAVSRLANRIHNENSG